MGAAIRTASGKIFQGCNVENVSYGLTICAERVAACSAVAAGEREFTDIAVVSNGALRPAVLAVNSSPSSIRTCESSWSTRCIKTTATSRRSPYYSPVASTRTSSIAVEEARTFLYASRFRNSASPRPSLSIASCNLAS